MSLSDTEKTVLENDPFGAISLDDVQSQEKTLGD